MTLKRAHAAYAVNCATKLSIARSEERHATLITFITQTAP